MTENDYPASCMAHWSTGATPCCDEHARGLVALGRFMGLHVPITALTEPAQCTNCANEAEARKDD